LAGCAIDVYPDEPKKNTDNFYNCLQGCPNTILTPHIEGATEEAQYNIGIDTTRKILDYVNHGDSYDSINFPKIQINNNIKDNI